MKILLIAALMLTTADLVAAKGWRGIVPLHSTRIDVERLLGRPEGAKRSSFESYKAGDEFVHVWYSSGNCDDDGWRVPRDTVTSFEVSATANRISPQKLFENLGIDLKTFNRYTNVGHELETIYVNGDEGMFVSVATVDEKETVNFVSYGPTKKDEYLRCAGYPKKDVHRCPRSTQIWIDGPNEPVESGTQIKLEVTVGSGAEIPPLTYEWSTSAGRITNSNGTSEIVLDTEGLKNQDVTGNVKVKGLPPACADSASFKVQVFGKQ
jgi:hypothetical protein